MYPPRQLTFSSGARLPVALLRTGALVLAAAGGGCANGTGAWADKPNWSLADKPPIALGGQTAEPKTALPDAPSYPYKGGRDPVTGRAKSASDADDRSVSAVGMGAGVGAPPPSLDGSTRLVEVRKGDTLHGLSLTHHVSVKALMDANHLASTVIVPGKTLIVPQG